MASTIFGGNHAINQDKSRPAVTYSGSKQLRVYRFSAQTKVHPRSSSGKFHLKKNLSGIIITDDLKSSLQKNTMTVSVFSSNGKMKLKKSFLSGQQCCISIRDFPAGVYIIKITPEKVLSDVNNVFCEKLLLR